MSALHLVASVASSGDWSSVTAALGKPVTLISLGLIALVFMIPKGSGRR
jgi:hypothetical protein